MSQVRHKVQTKVRANQLREAGWSLLQIQAILEREGVRPVPSQNTIWTWVTAKAHTRQNTQKRLADRARRIAVSEFRWPGVRSPEWKLARMRRLREAGMSCAAIATVMTIDFPDTPVTQSQVDYAVRLGGTPRSFKAAA